MLTVSDKFGKPSYQGITTYGLTGAPLDGASSKKKPVSQNYAQIPDYMGLAKEYLPTPKPLTPIDQMPEYSKASGTDNQSFENRWKLTSDDLRKSFYGSGGANDQAVEGVIERGLGTSGDRGRVMTDVADKFATALANARLGLESEKMNQDQSAAMALLNARGERDMYESRQPFEYGQSVLNAASGLTSAQNDTLARAWEQGMQESSFDAEKEMQSRNAEEQMRRQRTEELMQILGQVDFSKEEEAKMIESWAKQTGSPIAEFYKKEVPKKNPVETLPWMEQYIRDQWMQQNSHGVRGRGAATKPPFPGAFIGEKILNFVWDGSTWR